MRKDLITVCRKLIKIIFIILFMLYLSYLIYLTFFSRLYGRAYIFRSINIIPFKTIIEFLTAKINTDIIVTNIIGNIAAFMPMGFLLPIIFKRLKTINRLIAAILFATVSIEVIQYIAGVGATDIDDIILNLSGGILGYLIYKVFVKTIEGLIKHENSRVKKKTISRL
jgi:glycopeptide antibiotics resistance protein